MSGGSLALRAERLSRPTTWPALQLAAWTATSATIPEIYMAKIDEQCEHFDSWKAMLSKFAATLSACEVAALSGAVGINISGGGSGDHGTSKICL